MDCIAYGFRQGPQCVSRNDLRKSWRSRDHRDGKRMVLSERVEHASSCILTHVRDLNVCASPRGDLFFSSVLRERQAAIAQTGDGSLEKKNL